MKTVASLDDLNRLAVEQGAVASVNGRVINATGAQLKVGPRPVAMPPATPPEPPPPAPPAFSMEDVEQLLRERDEQWEKRLDALSTAILMIGQKSAHTPHDWEFIPEYGEKGEIIHIRAVALTRTEATAQ